MKKKYLGTVSRKHVNLFECSVGKKKRAKRVSDPNVTSIESTEQRCKEQRKCKDYCENWAIERYISRDVFPCFYEHCFLIDNCFVAFCSARNYKTKKG